MMMEIVMVPATRHGILYEDIGDTQERILSFLAALSSKEDAGGIGGRNETLEQTV